MRRLREERGWSQAQLAEHADLSVQFVAALEQEGRSASLTTIAKLAGGLGVKMSELFAAGESKSTSKTAISEKLARVLDGLTSTQQDHIFNAVREMRALVPRTKSKGKK